MDTVGPRLHTVERVAMRSLERVLECLRPPCDLVLDLSRSLRPRVPLLLRPRLR
jgi:hypothetical protein